MIDPREIVEVKFESSLRGYSKKEVDHFLEDLTDKIEEENARYGELERKCNALKLQVEDVMAQAEEERAERDALRAEAQAVLDSARAEAERILSDARGEQKKSALQAKFDAEKAVAAAKREAIVLSEEAKTKAKAVELASHRAADRVIGDAKAKAQAILADATRRSDELLLNAQASVESERILFAQLKEEIFAKSEELSALLSAQLADMGDFTERVRRTNFGEIPADREELLARFAHPLSEETVPVQETEKAPDVCADGEAYETEGDYTEEENAVDHTDEDAVVYDEDDGAYGDTYAEEVGVYVDSDEDTYADEDDDTYGDGDTYGGSAVPTAEFDGLPQTKDQLGDLNTSRALTDDELDLIFSFDVEEILSDDTE